MQPSRRSQPHKRGGPARSPGEALAAMTRGAPAHMANPADLTRATQKRARRRRARTVGKPLPAPQPQPLRFIWPR
jgi:hypothetical protein